MVFGYGALRRYLGLDEGYKGGTLIMRLAPFLEETPASLPSLSLSLPLSLLDM